MKKGLLYFVVASLICVLQSCSDSTNEHEELSAAEQLSDFYSADKLKDQSFLIDPSKDTVVRGMHGTEIRIPKNTFVDLSGKLVTEPVEVKLKEALSPFAIVQANLTTTSNGKQLQTGGMIHVDARCDEWPVKIAADKSIGVSIPEKEKLDGMQFFQGVETEKGINWVNPTALMEEVPSDKNIVAPASTAENQQTGGQSGFGSTSSRSDLDLLFDYVDSIAPTLPKVQPRDNWGNITQKPFRGANSLIVDTRIDYIFEMKELGWANIDRFYEDPRTQEVDLVTKITNEDQFDAIFITLVASKMYIPGYQKKDGTFSFTHGDYERTKLPIGEKATILATSYKNGTPYFDIISTTIKEKETITLTLNLTSEEALKQELKAKL